MTVKKMFEKLVYENGCTETIAYAILGNLKAESSLKANNLQNTFNTKLNMTDDEYTSNVDNNTYANFIHDGAGYGLAQWTYWSRKQALYDYCSEIGISIGSPVAQIDFLCAELRKNYGKLFTKMLDMTLEEATEAFMKEYEKPSNTNEEEVNKRIQYAKEYKDAVEGKEVIKEADILIAHASISETGTINGNKGDSTGKEVCIRNYYDKEWQYIIRPTSKITAIKIASNMIDACENNHIGYGQSDRNTGYEMYKKYNSIKDIKEDCNVDCSSLVHLAIVASCNEYFKNWIDNSNNSATTRNLRVLAKDSDKFDIIQFKKESLKVGDILLKEGSHCAVVIGV